MDHNKFRTAAQGFADTLSRLLNASVCSGVRISYVIPRPGWAILGRGVSPDSTKAQLIPLDKCMSQGVSLYMTLSYNLEPDEHDQHVMVTSSVLGLSLSEDRGKRELLHADYERGKAGYPEAHLQVTASSDDWTAVLSGRGGNDPLKKLHLPAGGRRYRTTLEDMIEFLIDERLMPNDRPGWRDVIEESRAEFAERQLRAAVRRHPDIARDELGLPPAGDQ